MWSAYSHISAYYRDVVIELGAYCTVLEHRAYTYVEQTLIIHALHIHPCMAAITEPPSC